MVRRPSSPSRCTSSFSETPLFDTHAGLVVAYVAFTLPFTTWLLIPYVSQIPEWLEEAAMVDGSTRVGAFARVFLPVARPGARGGVRARLDARVQRVPVRRVAHRLPARRTLPVGLTFEAVPPGVVSVVASIPMLVIFAVLWWFFLRGGVRRYDR